MSNENQQSTTPAKVANVALTRAMLAEPATINDMLALDVLGNRWVSVYEKLTGKPDGEMRWEAEKILFSQALATNATAWAKVDRFTIYACLTELAISGLTLRDGIAYMVPFGTKAQFIPGWKGRLEQMLEIPNVIHVQEPQVVYDCDTFDYEKGMETKIHRHVPQFPRPAGAIILYVYMVVQYNHGRVVFMMDRDDVINIRDKYSKSYKSYMNALNTELNKDREVGDTLKGTAKGASGWYEYDLEAPMWLSSEAQAFKKTLVKRAWNNMEKLPKHKAMDDKLKQFYDENPTIANLDPDELADRMKAKQQEDEIAAVYADIVDEGTGEVTGQGGAAATTETAAERKKREKAEKAAAAAATPPAAQQGEATPEEEDTF